MVCTVCGKVLLPSRAVFRCYCGVISHAYCWERHVVQAHRPAFSIGHLDLNGKFKPNEAGATKSKQLVKRQQVTAEKTAIRPDEKQLEVKVK